MSGRALRWLASLLHHPGSPSSPRLTIVRHHRVYAASERPLYRIGVSERVLEGQLAMLERAGLAPVTVSEGLERLEEGAPRVVAMTFDDGYADNVSRAVPLLERHGGRATFYLAAGLIESRTAPWWDVLAHLLERTSRTVLRWNVGGRTYTAGLAGAGGRARALRLLLPALRVPPGEQASRLAELGVLLGVAGSAPCRLADWDAASRLAMGGHEIGAHTLTHPFLSLLSRAEQEREIAGSVELIERRLGTRARGFAYPGGDYDGTSLGAVRAAGLVHAVTTTPGDVAVGAPCLELKRRSWSEGACLAPGGRFSARLARAELDGAFDGLRARAVPEGAS